MKSALHYIDSRGPCGKMLSLSHSSLNEKPDFFILPDRRMSFIKILILPPVSRGKLRDMVRFQIMRIYPGTDEEISFDFIPFRIKAGWKVVLYVIKKKYIEEMSADKRFRGIMLPLQLIPKKILHKLTRLIIHYPDMVEEWRVESGTPDSLQRYSIRNCSQSARQFEENRSSGPGTCMVIVREAEAGARETGNGARKTMSFYELWNMKNQRAAYFPEYEVNDTDKKTPLISFTAFVLSIILLILMYSEQKELQVKMENTDARVAEARLETGEVRKRLRTIETLDGELQGARDRAPANVYGLMLRAAGALDKDTVILSFLYKTGELSLDLRSANALFNLESIEAEFGNVRASSIRAHSDGSERYRVWVKVDHEE